MVSWVFIGGKVLIPIPVAALWCVRRASRLVCLFIWLGGCWLAIEKGNRSRDGLLLLEGSLGMPRIAEGGGGGD